LDNRLRSAAVAIRSLTFRAAAVAFAFVKARPVMNALLSAGLAAAASAAPDDVRLPATPRVPVAREVDVVVVGGGSGAVAAAAAAARAGAKVFLAAPRTYLGDDLCGPCRLRPEREGPPRSDLAKSLFPDGKPVAPMTVKRALDRHLLDAGVEFLFGCQPAGLLVDEAGRPAGVVLAGRAGRQAVAARVVIDATDRAALARLAGAAFAPYPAGPASFRRVVVVKDPKGAAPARPRAGEGVTVAEWPVPPAGGEGLRAFEYTLTIDMPDGSFRSFAAAEQIARDRTFDPAQVDASEFLFQIPPDPVRGATRIEGAWPGAEKADLDAFRPAGVEHLYVLGGGADVSREAAGALLEADEFIRTGERVGAAAAREAAARKAPASLAIAKTAAPPLPAGTAWREAEDGFRPVGPRPAARVEETAPGAADWGAYDVLVVGGGTSGAPAGIGAARRGARALVIEYLHELGGVSTLGLIGKYYGGYRGGYTAEHDRDTAEIEAAVRVIGKAEAFRRAAREAGAEIWTGALATGALVRDGRVVGVVVATPHGVGLVRARVVIDATGNADVAAAAGAACEFVSDESVAMQGSGLSPRTPGASYSNTDHTFIDESDLVDVWRAFVGTREKFASSYDIVPMPLTRERRRIVGEYTVTPVDLLTGRRYRDTLYLARGGFDTHGFTDDAFFLLGAEGPGGGYVPYRALIPKGLEGLLVTGLATSADRDAMPPMRMQPDLQNQGYAAGTAAAMAAGDGTVRGVDVRALQRHLVETGNLPKEVLEHDDASPVTDEVLVAAVGTLAGSEWQPSAKNNPVEGQTAPGLAAILARPDAARPRLREAMAKAETPEAKLIYAHVLGMLGDASAAPALLEAVRAGAWDAGWDYRGMGQFGVSLSRMDSYIVALGRTGAPEALVPVLEKLAQLEPDASFSHARAVSLALESLGRRESAPALAAYLRRPGVGGHAVTSIDAELKGLVPNANDTSVRNRALREIVVARALYRCGDDGGLGEATLRAYAADLRGVFARHAEAVLRAGPTARR
jgi:flavin-dependent dehydrogenase